MADMDFYSADPVLEESVSNVTATNSVKLGARCIYKAEEYVYCYNGGSEQISQNKGVKALTGASGYTVTVSSVTDSVNPCVGVAKNATITTGAYGWIMVKGYTSVNVVTATTSDHVALALGADGKFVNHAPLTDAVHVGTYNVCGYGLNVNTGAGGSVYAKIVGDQ